MNGFLEYVPGTSLMHRLNPIVKLLGAIVFAVACFFSSNLVFLACMLVLALAMAASCGMMKPTIGLMKAVFAFSLLLAIIQILFTPSGDALVVLPWGYIGTGSLIAALTVAIRPGGVHKKTLRLPVLAFFCAAILYSLIAYTTGAFARWQGIGFLCLFVAYMIVTVLQMKKNPEAVETEQAEEPAKERPLWQELLFLVVGAAAIAFGANLLVDNGTKIAAALGVPDSVIGLTMVALGTSLPELVTAITALIKGHSALSLGNIIGANLFNIVLVSGTAITISPFAIPVEKTLLGRNASLMVDIPVMMAVMAILCFPALAKGKLARWQGIALLCIYVAFTALQFAM